jgi:tight adherence protein C
MILSRENIPIMIGALAFLAIYFFFIGIMHYLRQRAKRRELIERMRHEDEQWDTKHTQDPTTKAKGLLPESIANFLGSMGRRAASDQSADYSRMRLEFLRAGLRRPNVAAIFYGTKSFLAMFLPSVFFFFRLTVTVFKLLTLPATLVICLLLALLGFYLPDVWLRFKTSRRKEKIVDGVPDALDLLVVCVEAGMGLNAAINRVGEEIRLSNRPLSDEFKLLAMELRTGKSREDALRNLAKRTDSEDVNSLVTLLIQTDKFGTSVARALRIYADVFRTKRYQRAEEIAAKIPVKLLFPLIFLIFPSLFAVILGPAVIRLMALFASL